MFSKVYLTLDNLCWCGFHRLRQPCPWKMAIVSGCFEYGEGTMEWICVHIACKMGRWRIFWPSFESTCENVKNNSYCILEAGVSNSKLSPLIAGIFLQHVWRLGQWHRYIGKWLVALPKWHFSNYFAQCDDQFYKHRFFFPAQCGCAPDDREVALEPKLHQTIWMCDKAAFCLVARYWLSALWLERRG